MLQALLLAIGISSCLAGGECLVLDKVVLAQPGETAEASPYGQTDLLLTGPQRVFVPPEWAPWGLLAGGAAAVLYSKSMPGGAEG